MSDEKFTSMEKTGQFGDKVMKPEPGNVDDLRRKLLYLETCCRQENLKLERTIKATREMENTKEVLTKKV